VKEIIEENKEGRKEERKRRKGGILKGSEVPIIIPNTGTTANR
jgi:hypothetical protein